MRFLLASELSGKKKGVLRDDTPFAAKARQPKSPKREEASREVTELLARAQYII
jgi:hypothetical protein